MKPLLLLLYILPFIGYSQSVVYLESRKIDFALSIDQEVVAWNEAQPRYPSLTKEEKDILYWTNYARKNPTRFWDSVMQPLIAVYPQLRGSYAQSLHRDLYDARPLAFLRLNDTLIQTARSHARDIGSRSSSVSHTSSDGTSFAQRLQQSGIRNCGSENMSLGAGDVLVSLAMLYLDHGLANLGHRKTLLNADYSEIGIGATVYHGGQLFFVQDFACEQN